VKVLAYAGQTKVLKLYALRKQTVEPVFEIIRLEADSAPTMASDSGCFLSNVRRNGTESRIKR
jgi:hypothetical protein